MVTTLITSQFSTISYAFYGCMYTNHTFQSFRIFTPGFHLTQWLHMVPVENLGRMPVDITEILQLGPWIKADLV